MTVTKLIQTNDISNIKAISDNIDAIERIDPYIIEAQDLDIRPFLGEPLFYDLLTNPTTTSNVALLNGGEYTDDDYPIFYTGLKVAIAYFAYSRFISNQGVNVTRFGIVKKITDNSEPVDSATIDSLAGNARSIGLSYLNQIERFLDHDATLTSPAYPLWRIEESRKPRTKVKITKVVNY